MIKLLVLKTCNFLKKAEINKIELHNSKFFNVKETFLLIDKTRTGGITII